MFNLFIFRIRLWTARNCHKRDRANTYRDNLQLCGWILLHHWLQHDGK